MKKTLLILLAMVTGMTAIALTLNARQAKSAKEARQTWYNVYGHVTDECDASLPGVSVVVKGTTTGITTDLNGNYNLSPRFVLSGTTIVFSYIGYKTKEITVTKARIDVRMEPDAQGVQ